MSPDGLTEMERVAGVWVADWLTLSQDPPEVVVAEAASGLGKLLNTETVWAAGWGSAEVL